MIISAVKSSEAGPAPSALLLLLLDSRAPTGANAHSAGMEAAVTAGWVEKPADVESFCRGKLRTSGLVAATFAAAACRLTIAEPNERDGWRELDEEFEARTAAEALRDASRQLGSGLRRLLRATLPELSAELDTAWLALPA